MSADPFHFPPATGTPEAESYQHFVESMVPLCHCDSQYRPCDGVLAGGICDGMHDEEPRDEGYDEDGDRLP